MKGLISMVGLYELLDDYYSQADLFDYPSMSRREFAFESWTWDGPSDRNHCFPSTEILRSIIRIKKPKAVFASNARYLDPGHVKMDKKTITGVDLAFDFDFGDLPEHELSDDFWSNMDSVAIHVNRLLDKALPTLGISTDNVMISFSGGKGFHVRILDESILSLNRNQRRNIRDFVRGNELSNYHTFAIGKKKGKHSPRFDPALKGGWPGFYAEASQTYLKTIHDSPKSIAIEFVKANLPLHTSGEKKGQKKTPSDESIKEIVDIVQSNSSILKGGVFARYFAKKNQMALVRDSISRFAILNNGCAIDLSVTDDMRRILRVPGSIHGKTGLPCMLLERHEINSESIKRKVAEVVGNDLVSITIPHLVKTPLGVYDSDITELPRHEALSVLSVLTHEKN